MEKSFLLSYPHKALCSDCRYHVVSYIERTFDGRNINIETWSCGRLNIDIDPSTMERCNMKEIIKKII